MSKWISYTTLGLSVLFFICPVFSQGNTDDSQSFVLTYPSSKEKSDSFRLTNRDIQNASSSQPIAWSIEKSTLHGGKQEGCELITIDNGAMKILVVPTRGMSILRITKRSSSGDPKDPGMELGWDSPVKEVVHPQFVNLESRGGLGWLEGFNEWLVRCGLESAGHPGKDDFVNNVGDKVEMNLTLHGKIGNIPASNVVVLVDRKAPYRIRVQGVVNERMFYGPKLELITEISTVPGSNSLRITDRLINHGADDQEFQLIYHTNFGQPLLEKGATTIVAAERIEPMNAHAAKSIKSYSAYEPPTKGFVEQVYLVHPKSDSAGRAHALFKNATGNQGVSVTWQTSQLPYFTLWKNTAADADGYVTGLEPGTGFPFNRNIERKFGRVPKLAAGKSRTFELDYSLLEGAKEVEEFEAVIKRLQGVPPTIALQPASIPAP